MPIRDEIRIAIDEHIKQGTTLLRAFAKKEKGSEANFRFDYQKWYSIALPLVHSLARDRYEEFRRYYEPDPKRKGLGYGDYVIQDYIKGVAPSSYHFSNFDTHEQAGLSFVNQVAILTSISSRIDSILSNVEGAIIADLKDAELHTANDLVIASPRAAGALAGVVLEAHLQRVARLHGIKIAKKSPTISDLNDPLKQANVYDTATWRKISYLADIRNLCSHRKATDPTHEQVAELISGVNWAIKNIV